MSLRPRPGRRLGFGRAVCVVTLACSAPGCQRSVDPYPEALVVVDTDLPVPRMAGRFRVDLYAEDGTWYESRDIGRPGLPDWPVSFSVYTKDASRDTRVLVRLRIYPDSLLRDYRGERYENRNGPLPGAAGPQDVGPRLVVDGVDVTPSSEPEPLATVDRLVLVRLQPARRGRVRITLHGSCLGTMALLGQTPPYQHPTLDQAVTCIDTENTLFPVTEAPLESDMTRPPSTQLGTFAAGETCDPSLHDPRAACVPGGVFVMGDTASVNRGGRYDAVPVHAAVLHRFWLDRDEVTVAQLRVAVSQGFRRGAPLGVVGHEAPLGTLLASDLAPQDKWCTWTANPGGRENHPLNCIDWAFAHEYCRFVGGDLPTEAQWEYAAGTAGRPFRTTFPAAATAPSCSDAVVDRLTPEGLPSGCSLLPPGPQPLGTAPPDLTPLGISNMTGSQAEIVLDELSAYSSPCWRTAALGNPVCQGTGTALHALRGGSWAHRPQDAAVYVRDDANLLVVRSQFGFRCAFPTQPSP